jgi:hypothetical protein
VVAKFVLLTTLVLITSLSNGAGLGRKTDVITFYNGDKVTGEIKNLISGKLEVSTNAMGTLKIEWKEIATLESLYHYEIRLADGKRYYGKIDNSANAGELSVSDLYGDYGISALDIVEIRPVAESFKDRIDIYLSAGYSYTKASSLGQTSLNSDISYEDEKTRNALSARLVITDTDGEQTRSAKVDLTRSVWTNRQDIYRIILGSYETNDELALDYRLSVGGGLGRYFADTRRSTWTGALGLQVLTEKSLEGSTQESAEVVLNTNYSTWNFDTPELDLKFDLSIFPSITESGRVRGNTDLKLRWEIVEDFFWDITAFGTYDNKSAEDTRVDYGITTGVGWKY